MELHRTNFRRCNNLLLRPGDAAALGETGLGKGWGLFGSDFISNADAGKQDFIDAGAAGGAENLNFWGCWWMVDVFDF